MTTRGDERMVTIIDEHEKEKMKSNQTESAARAVYLHKIYEQNKNKYSRDFINQRDHNSHTRTHEARDYGRNAGVYNPAEVLLHQMVYQSAKNGDSMISRNLVRIKD